MAGAQGHVGGPLFACMGACLRSTQHYHLVHLMNSLILQVLDGWGVEDGSDDSGAGGTGGGWLSACLRSTHHFYVVHHATSGNLRWNNILRIHIMLYKNIMYWCNSTMFQGALRHCGRSVVVVCMYAWMSQIHPLLSFVHLQTPTSCRPCSKTFCYT